MARHRKNFNGILSEISRHVTPAEIEAIFNLNRYFRHVDTVFCPGVR